MPPAATAFFMSLRSDLVVIERAAVPIFENGRQVRTEPGKTHVFKDHQCKVEGQRSIEFMRERIKAGLDAYELDGASDIRPLPEVLVELATADVDRVRAIMREESDGPQRPAILDTCRAVLDKIGVAERKPGQTHDLVTG